MATGYRVTTETGTVEFTEHDKAIAYHAEHGIGEIEPFEIQAPAWDKDSYMHEVNIAHSEWYRKIYSRKPDLDYEDKADIEFYCSHEDDALRNQAISLRQLWFTSIDIMYLHFEEVTSETANVDLFISSLPSF